VLPIPRKAPKRETRRPALQYPKRAAAVKAISEVPQINARFHEEFLEVFKQINIGVGTALGESGLVVPVVRDVQNKTLLDIASDLQGQIKKARSGKLRSEDMQNGTFTISNHGVSGSLFATPIIINQPQVAILGIGKIEKRAVVRAVGGLDEISIKTMCYVSLTIDHRALDAYQTNQFLMVLVETLEGWGV
jgi:2-oxoglutarate dehydrogenase E2 component (dihydrolipoamide succinyltransferase)